MLGHVSLVSKYLLVDQCELFHLLFSNLCKIVFVLFHTNYDVNDFYDEKCQFDVIVDMLTDQLRI